MPEPVPESVPEAVSESVPVPVSEAGGWGSCAGPLVDAHDVLLLDLDGVVYIGPDAVPGAAEALAAVRERGVRLAFVTNNAARPPSVVAEHLADLGVPASVEDVVTSAQAAAALLAAELEAGDRVLATGAEGLWQALTEAGLRPVASADDDPVAVVQGFSPELDWQMLLETCVAVRAGLPWVATNNDATLPTPRGEAPGNGAFVDVVRRTTGREPRVAGKPFRPLMDESVRRTGARHGLVVGDRLDTDVAGARAAGLPSLLVLTGVSRVYDLLRAPPEHRPTYLSADLTGMLEAHDAPVRDPAGWTCAGHRAVWAGPTSAPELRLTGPATTGPGGEPGGGAEPDARAAAAAVRVACAALWNRLDDIGGAGDVDDVSDVDDIGDVDDVDDVDDVEGTSLTGDVELLVHAARTALQPWTVPVGWDR